MKQKLVHTYGIHGTCTYVPDDGVTYTGFWQEGSDYCVLRLSDAGFIFEPIEEHDVFTPSAAIKFFVDGDSSRNILLQFNFDGTDDPYFFANDLSTHMQRSTNQANIDTIERKFADATEYTFEVGTS